MALSKMPYYREYGRHLVAENYVLAIECLQRLIEENGADLVEDEISYITSCIGRLFFLSGDRDKSLRLFIESEEIAEGSYQAKYLFAQFLLNDLKDIPAGLKKCKDCIDALRNSPFEESDQDFSSQSYIKRFEELASNFS